MSPGSGIPWGVPCPPCPRSSPPSVPPTGGPSVGRRSKALPPLGILRIPPGGSGVANPNQTSGGRKKLHAVQQVEEQGRQPEPEGEIPLPIPLPPGGMNT